MWLPLALGAYILFAGATITDKYLLRGPIPHPKVYAFYTGIFGLFSFVLAPLGFQIPRPEVMALDVFAGVVFIAALFLFFIALKAGEVSRIGISLGGLVPLFTLVFTYIGTGNEPTRNEFLAFSFLVGGALLVAFDQYALLLHNLRNFGLVLASSFLFGFYFFFVKFLFTIQSFISAFIWIKIGGALFVLLFLLSPQVRLILLSHKKSSLKKAGSIFVIKNAAGGVGALFLHLAVSAARVSEVALVNALQGAQFALVFLLAVFLTKKFPEIVKEKLNRQAMIVKLVGTGLVVAGVALLATQSQ